MAEEIATALVALDDSQLARSSLASGAAGIALALSYAHAAGVAAASPTHVRRCADFAVAGVAEQPLNPSLWFGFTGVAWTLAHLARMGLAAQATSTGEKFNVDADDAEVLDALTLWVDHPSAGRDLGLVAGPVGAGLYVLENGHASGDGPTQLLTRVVMRLAREARHASIGLAWLTPPDDSADAVDPAPDGYYNLGMAHGLTGLIAFLSAVLCSTDRGNPSRPAAESLLRGAVDWLLATRLQPGERSCFPGWVIPHRPPHASRLAWCYGDLGVAVSLVAAAHVLAEPSWADTALDVATTAAGRQFEDSEVRDAGLCHGGAGVAHLFNRLYHATGDERLRAAALRWLEWVLDFRTSGTGVAGYARYDGSSRTGRVPTWVPDPGLLNGAAGVALALLGATTAIPPLWDRSLGLGALEAAVPPLPTSVAAAPSTV